MVLVLAGTVGWAGVIGCGDAAEEVQPPELTRRDPEPAGTNCRYGGTAVRRGVDRDTDGVLDDDEIVETQYECSDATTLVRVDGLVSNLTCPAGGTATHTGVDDNGDGVLQDIEIDQTTIQCRSLEQWDGDFTAADWSDPVKVAALRGARVVDGSLTIAGATDIELPLLEVVRGDLLVRGLMREVALPALREVTGRVDVDAPILFELSLVALEHIGGELAIQSTDGPDASITAPSLREVGGSLVLGSQARGTVSLPALRSVSTLIDAGTLAALHLDALTSVAGDLSVGDRGLTRLTLPSLRTIAGDLTSGQLGVPSTSIATIDLPALEQLGGDLHIEGLSALTTVLLPAVTRIGGDISIESANALVTLDLAELEEIAGTVRIELATALSTINAPSLRTIGSDEGSSTSIRVSFTGLEDLDLGSLSMVSGGITMQANAKLRAMQLPALTSAETLFIEGASALEVVAIPLLPSISTIVVVDAPALRSFDVGALVDVPFVVMFVRCALPDLSGFGALARVRSLTLDRVDQLESLRGLAALQQVRTLEITGNPVLGSLDGLDAITALTGGVSISDNPALTSVAGLRNVVSVDGSLEISRNASLPAIALTSLSTIGGALTITSNTALTSLSGLDALTAVTGALVVTGNDGIPAEEIEAFRTRLGK